MPELPRASEAGHFDQELLSLITQTADGDEEALAHLYDRTSSHVFGFALRVLEDPGMAEEVTLDVYMQVWRQAGQFDQHRGNPMVWLAMITRSRAIDRLRVGQHERHRRASLETVEGTINQGDDPEALRFVAEQRSVIQAALSSLAPDQKKAIEMAYFQGLSQSAIANKLGEPLGTIKTRIRLGMSKLRHILGPFQEGLAL